MRAIAGTPFVLVSTDGRARGALARELRADPRVVRVEPNLVRTAAAAPTDPYYAKGRQGYLRPLRFEQAWGAVPSAAGVTVAVVDTGVDLDTPELADRILPGWDVVNGDSDPSDDNGHGTAVAGVLAAAHDGTGIAGAAPGASILPVKVLDAQGQGTDADVASGITWAADHGAQVINLSLGGPGDSQVLRDAVAYAVSKDVVVVAAAGNDEGTTPSYPAAIPAVVAVSATDWAGDATYFTSYGNWVDVAAPGWDLWTTAMAPGAVSRYESFSGTSASAPLVAGAAALVRAQNPGWTQQQVVDRILASAHDVGPRGRDPYDGAGLLDAYAAVGGPAQPASSPAAGDAVEPNGTPARATPLTLGTAVWATISPQGDTDWYSLTAGSTGQYLIDVQPNTALAARAQGFDPVIEVYDSSLRLVASEDAAGIDAEESTLVNLAAGSYLVLITNYAPSRSPAPYAVEATLYGSGSPGRFLPYDALNVGGEPTATAIGDVTGDGRADVLVAGGAGGATSPYDASLIVFPQVDDGWLGPPAQVLPLGVGSQDQPAIGVLDLNGDGLADVAVGTLSGVELFDQQPGGGLAAAGTIPIAGVRRLAVADVTGDGQKDIVVATDPDGSSTSGDGIYVLAAPSWTQTEVEAGMAHGAIAVGDLNGDGLPDVAASEATVYYSTRLVDTYLQGAGGSWSAGPQLTSPYTPDSVAVGDVTGDRQADIVIGSWESQGIAVFPQTSSGFGSPVGSFNPGAGAVAIADMNGDGRNDVVSAAYGTLGIQLQQSDGTLGAAERNGFGADTGVLPQGIAVGDFTGDGVPDVALGPWSYGWVVFLRQRSATWPRPLWVRDTTPAEGGAASGTVSVGLGRDADATTVNGTTVTVADAATGAAVPASVSYDAGTRTISVQPATSAGSAYVLTLDGVRDAAGNALHGWTLRFTAGAPAADTTPPDTLIYDAPPPLIAKDLNLEIEQVATEAGSRFECSMDGSAWRDCSEHYELGGPYGAGAHTYRVRAIDGAGNADPTPASVSWTVDSSLTPPANDAFSNAQPISGPSGSVTGSNVDAWYDNSSPIADNRGGCSVWYSWTAPASGPVTITTAGSGFDTLLGVYTGTSQYALTTVAENDDAGGSLTSSVTFDAVGGTVYSIAVDGYSAEANAATGSISLQWSSSGSDSVPPAATLTAPGDGAVVGTSASLAADASDDVGVAKVDFLVDGNVVATDTTAPYTGTWSTAGLANGSTHTLAARATDLSGNATTSASVTVTVDNVAPQTTITSSPPASTVDTSASFGFSADEPATFECALDGAAWSSCTSPASYSGLAVGSHTFQVRARDGAGNVDATPASYTWTVQSATGPPPPPTAPAPALVANATYDDGTVPTQLTWSASGATGYELQESEGGGSFVDVPLTSPSATTATLTLATGASYDFRVRATDGSGTWSDWATAAPFTPAAQQDDARAIAYAGKWSHDHDKDAWGGSLRWAGGGGATATLSFTGSSVAWIAPRTAASGIAEVWIDGALAATVDLYAASTQPRQAVFAAGLAPGSHTVQIRVLGTRNASSSSTRVDLDAFVVLGG